MTGEAVRAARRGRRAGAGAALRATSDLLDRFTAVFQAVAGFALLLALLIAFNAASINADERAREHATMVAYGSGSGRCCGWPWWKAA